MNLGFRLVLVEQSTFFWRRHPDGRAVQPEEGSRVGTSRWPALASPKRYFCPDLWHTSRSPPTSFCY